MFRTLLHLLLILPLLLNALQEELMAMLQEKLRNMPAPAAAGESPADKEQVRRPWSAAASGAACRARSVWRASWPRKRGHEDLARTACLPG